jgi:ubiquinone/menaquinone biosynthesis C-methylase UbiE
LNNLFFIRASVFSLPFVDAAFPYVNCCGALHLFDRPDAALTEIRRVLEPGGYLCVQTTIRPARSAGFAFFLERFIRFGFFDESGLREQLRLRGFSILESERHRISFTFLASRES